MPASSPPPHGALLHACCIIWLFRAVGTPSSIISYPCVRSKGHPSNTSRFDDRPPLCTSNGVRSQGASRRMCVEHRHRHFTMRRHSPVAWWTSWHLPSRSRCQTSHVIICNSNSHHAFVLQRSAVHQSVVNALHHDYPPPTAFPSSRNERPTASTTKGGSETSPRAIHNAHFRDVDMTVWPVNRTFDSSQPLVPTLGGRNVYSGYAYPLSTRKRRKEAAAGTYYRGALVTGRDNKDFWVA